MFYLGMGEEKKILVYALEVIGFMSSEFTLNVVCIEIGAESTNRITISYLQRNEWNN